MDRRFSLTSPVAKIYRELRPFIASFSFFESLYDGVELLALLVENVFLCALSRQRLWLGAILLLGLDLAGSLSRLLRWLKENALEVVPIKPQEKSEEPDDRWK
jgi:hypothetical protein